jgi:molecular chaperone GrpE
MYKEMIPADIPTREAKSRRDGHAADEFAATQGLPTSGNGDVTLLAELAQWQDRCLRLAADFDNFKKRTSRESDRRAAELRNALVRELLPVVDNLERALTNNPAPSLERLGEGVQLTLRQLIQVLNQHGFTGRDDLGQPFDPQYHEAVCVRSEPMQPDDAILEVWQRGWLQGTALFRPAKVVVNDLKRSNQTAQETKHPK